METLTSQNNNVTKKELDRIESRIFYHNDGCWYVIGYLDKDGYGQILFRRKMCRFHRVTWYAVNGEIPNSMLIDHKCRHKNCVNPKHLRCVTPKINTIENSNSIQAKNSQKTHCPNGHQYDRVYRTNKLLNKFQRYCSICQAAKTKRLRSKK